MVMPAATSLASSAASASAWILARMSTSDRSQPCTLTPPFSLRSMYPRIARLALVAGLLPTLARGQTPQRPRSDVHCAPDNGGITLPKGFCATVFADSLARPRHLTVAPNGDVFVALQSGGVIALRDG